MGLIGRLYLPPLIRRKSKLRISRLDDVTYSKWPSIDRMVFICGLHRSGTTLLERLFATRFEVSFLRANKPQSEGQHLQTVFPTAREYGGPGRFAFSLEMAEKLENLTDHKQCRREILAEWSNFVVGGSRVLLEKSPPNLTKIWWLRRVFPGSMFVIVTRDPRAVSTATQKWGVTSLDELMRHWDVAYSKAMNDFSDSDCVVCRYEDLTEDPDKELERLGEFLKLRPRPKQDEIEDRFKKMVNSNDKYIEAHGGKSYGAGVWEKFGYSL